MYVHVGGIAVLADCVCKWNLKVHVWGFWEIYPFLLSLGLYNRRVGQGSEGRSVLSDIVQVLDALGLGAECGVFRDEGFGTEYGRLV